MAWDTEPKDRIVHKKVLKRTVSSTNDAGTTNDLDAKERS